MNLSGKYVIAGFVDNSSRVPGLSSLLTEAVAREDGTCVESLSICLRASELVMDTKRVSNRPEIFMGSFRIPLRGLILGGWRGMLGYGRSIQNDLKLPWFFGIFYGKRNHK